MRPGRPEPAGHRGRIDVGQVEHHRTADLPDPVAQLLDGSGGAFERAGRQFRLVDVGGEGADAVAPLLGEREPPVHRAAVLLADGPDPERHLAVDHLAPLGHEAAGHPDRLRAGLGDHHRLHDPGTGAQRPLQVPGECGPYRTPVPGGRDDEVVQALLGRPVADVRRDIAYRLAPLGLQQAAQVHLPLAPLVAARQRGEQLGAEFGHDQVRYEPAAQGLQAFETRCAHDGSIPSPDVLSSPSTLRSGEAGEPGGPVTHIRPGVHGAPSARTDRGTRMIRRRSPPQGLGQGSNRSQSPGAPLEPEWTTHPTRTTPGAYAARGARPTTPRPEDGDGPTTAQLSGSSARRYGPSRASEGPVRVSPWGPGPRRAS